MDRGFKSAETSMKVGKRAPKNSRKSQLRLLSVRVQGTEPLYFSSIRLRPLKAWKSFCSSFSTSSGMIPSPVEDEEGISAESGEVEDLPTLTEGVESGEGEEVGSRGRSCVLDER